MPVCSPVLSLTTVHLFYLISITLPLFLFYLLHYLLQLLHYNLGIVTWENDASQCFGCTVAYVLPLCRN